MSIRSRVYLVATGGGGNVAFEEALKKSQPDDHIHVVRAISEQDKKDEQVVEKTEKHFRSLQEMCLQKQRNCKFTLLETRYGGVNESIGVSHRADVGETICLAAQSINADEILLGFKGLGSFNRLVLGSVAEYCVYNCPLPVTIVKPDCITSDECRL